MQSTVRPTRFTRPAAPSNSRFQSPSERASHDTWVHGPLIFGADRERRTTFAPRSHRYFARDIPRNPEPPAITMRPETGASPITTSLAIIRWPTTDRLLPT